MNPKPTAANDLRAMSLIGLAHGSSHFFQLVLPALFPFLILDFAVGYTELGLLMTLLFVVSGFSQLAAGFAVDRFGAKRILIGGMVLYSLSVLAMALVTEFWMLYPLIVLAGLGNAAFHPADFTILNATVSTPRLGRAYAAHTLGGNLGWAAAPLLMVGIASLADWQTALLVAGGIGLVAVALLVANTGRLHDGAATGARPGPGEMALAPLLSTPVVLCFGYFALLATALIVIQNFLPPTLDALFQTPLALANLALTGFLLGASAGTLLGGFLADGQVRPDRIIGYGLAASALLIAVVGWVELGDVPLVAALAAAGFLSGMTTPSRDMLVRAATPAGATGRVFGFVYSGLDAGSAVAPAVAGYMLDNGAPEWVLSLVAGLLLAAIVTAVSVRVEERPQAAAAE